ncbi:hypothetical protein KFE25_010636 [Diacronema lutheri]|uniref:Uncharacterized protein n=1 Tax=Diacronema lutheri TaxID=2081491 RepID=A0A8J5XL71_DIALT|nr:hypothetical protein KFE25_010636 [Diacronema lutheri]
MDARVWEAKLGHMTLAEAPRDGTPSKLPRRFGKQQRAGAEADALANLRVAPDTLESGGVADGKGASSAGHTPSTSGAASPRDGRRTSPTTHTRARALGALLLIVLAVGAAGTLFLARGRRGGGVDALGGATAGGRAELAAIEADLGALRERLRQAEDAPRVVEARLASLRARFDAEGSSTRAQVAELEAHLRRVEADERVRAEREARTAHAAEADGRAHFEERARAATAATPRDARSASTDPGAAVHAADAAALRPAGGETPSARAPAAPTGAPSAPPADAAVTLLFEFAPTPLLGPAASIFWVADGVTDVELWYADIHQGRAPLAQRTKPGERWRVRDLHSGNHLLSVTAPAAGTMVAPIQPAHGDVSVELHRPDLALRARAARTDRIGGGGGELRGGASGTLVVDDVDASRTEVGEAGADADARVYRLKRSHARGALLAAADGGGGAAAGGADEAMRALALRSAIDGGSLLGMLPLGGRLAALEVRPGDAFLAVGSDGKVCLAYNVTHELHQHVNVRCARSSAGSLAPPPLVRVEFLLDDGAAAEASLLRLSEMPFAWHVHAQLAPRRPLSVITEPGERWQVRTRGGLGPVLADVVASARAFQRISIPAVAL